MRRTLELDWPEARGLAVGSSVVRGSAAVGAASRWLALLVVRRKANPEVHHKEFRSYSGRDSEENLITLGCLPHEQFPEAGRSSLGTDPANSNSRRKKPSVTL